MEQNVEKKENKMGVLPVNKLLINMSLPIMISMLVQALYNVVDSMFVSRVSENALTAVSLAFPAQNLMIAVATGTAVGVNALLSKSLGEKNQKRADSVAENGVFLALVGFVIFLLFGLWFIFFRLKLFIDNIDFVSNSLPKSLIAEGKPACSKRLIRKLFAVSNGNLVDFEQVNVNDVYELAFKEDGKTINLPFNNTAYVYNGRIGILSEEELEALHYSDAEQKGFLVIPEIFCMNMTSKDLETGKFSAKIPNSNITIIAEIIENISSLKYNNLSW